MADYGYEEMDMGYGDAADMGYGDAAPDSADKYGYGDSNNDYGYDKQDMGYGDDKQDMGYGYESQDMGYGDAAPDYGYGDSEPAAPAEPKRRPKRRCSVTKFSLQSPEAAKQELETGIEATGPSPAEDEKSLARTEDSSDEMDVPEHAEEHTDKIAEAPIEKKKFSQLKNGMQNGLGKMKKFGKRLSIF